MAIDSIDNSPSVDHVDHCPHRKPPFIEDFPAMFAEAWPPSLQVWGRTGPQRLKAKKRTGAT